MLLDLLAVGVAFLICSGAYWVACAAASGEERREPAAWLLLPAAVVSFGLTVGLVIDRDTALAAWTDDPLGIFWHQATAFAVVFGLGLIAAGKMLAGQLGQLQGWVPKAVIGTVLGLLVGLALGLAFDASAKRHARMLAIWQSLEDGRAVRLLAKDGQGATLALCEGKLMATGQRFVITEQEHWLPLEDAADFGEPDTQRYFCLPAALRRALDKNAAKGEGEKAGGQ